MKLQVRLKEIFPYHYRTTSDLISSFLGPLSIVATLYIVTEILADFVFPVGLGSFGFYAYFMIDTGHYFMILSAGAVYSLIFLRWAKDMIPSIWKWITPPFKTPKVRSEQTQTISEVKKSVRFALYFTLFGYLFGYIMPFFGVIPRRRGLIGRPVYGEIPLLSELFAALANFPIIQNVAFLSDFITTATTTGLLFVVVSTGSMIIGLRNMIYVFSNRSMILDESTRFGYELVVFVRYAPYFGFISSLMSVYFYI
ncbi:hypothetical protein [Haloarcula laminariae]|uniref:hypothetical protein n=1 Tax=Haloarcula laminariae TaxID=2961577 RepID=UPI0021C62143|nr:hypothetical protein [Halomicroarcula laminariae]